MTKQTIKIEQVPLVCAIIKEIARQCEDKGLVTLSGDTFSPVMTAIINAADDIKRDIDLVGLEGKAENDQD